jgi:y4mF family transcriptional regulator
MNITKIGLLVRLHRKKAGLSQEELGKLAGLGKTIIFDIEKGKLSIRFNNLLKILEILNIKITFHGPLMNLFKDQINEES